MNQKHTLDMPLLSLGMMAVLVARFLSALADNAILIAAIAIVKAQGLPSLVPLLQESFVVPFILLAPFVGQIADRFPKGRVMLIGNLLKFSGALAMTLVPCCPESCPSGSCRSTPPSAWSCSSTRWCRTESTVALPADSQPRDWRGLTRPVSSWP